VIRVFDLKSDALEARVLDYGATLMSLRSRDRRGAMGELVLGFSEAEGYRGAHPYFGGTVGRYANRIAQGRFNLDGRSYQLACNNGRNHLHGGVRGFDRVSWVGEQRGNSVMLRYTSRDGEEGYPGTLHATVTYIVEANRLTMDYLASAEAPTIVNLTNHAYFNLAGGGTVDAHVLRLQADRYVAVDEELIPTGELRAVQSTSMDFRGGRSIGTQEIDHTFVLHGAAEVHDPTSGRSLRIRTTQPGIQVYTGHLLDGSVAGYVKRGGLCLEPQHFPDSPNHAAFPSTVLRPGERYAHRSTYELTM
jgi:aldose 1-epimerase